MHKLITKLKHPATAVIILILIVIYCAFISKQHCPLLTNDQQGYIKFHKEEYKKAAEKFSNPMWKAVSYYKNGDFKQAAELFSGYENGIGRYNYGNALLMQGKYDEAIESYDAALLLKPNWKDAEINRAIAVIRAEKTKTEGGNMTEGQLGADEFTFTENKNKNDGFEEPDSGEAQTDDAAMRAIWLRKVQTKPEDFLKSKFIYQSEMERVIK